ncbi:SDR family NAD(P)-dependent oxidoreductase [Halogeometricum limi]|uniref:3-oxoacyl-[acyl-carrier-protein] reductase n=1 Tax=Halogeometricum limi TaxID=555875 RepID=A0A1I6ICP3_9EURY|nr:SDR family NAD(P)-dependent oxidoreductase [Halogeometricum limi]SFR64394.1 3-oxoacyl-[acyl-carrier-protein] reductase [Halogeometricum limi]
MIPLDLSGETALVTGGGRGIGAVVADTFAEAGADVAVAARTESELAKTVERIESHGRRGVALPTDLRDADAIEELVADATDRLGTPSILVNNAAANLAGPLSEMSVDEVDTMLETNLRATFLLSQAWADAYRESSRTSGRIINVSSLTGRLGVPRMTLYSGTNAGIESVSRGFAAELARDGVTVNWVVPGLVGIDRIRNLVDEQGDDIYDLDRIPLGDLGEAVDIAHACLFFASEMASYVTGAELVVDGGVSFTAGLYR